MASQVPCPGCGSQGIRETSFCKRCWSDVHPAIRTIIRRNQAVDSGDGTFVVNTFHLAAVLFSVNASRLLDRRSHWMAACEAFSDTMNDLDKLLRDPELIHNHKSGPTGSQGVG